MPDIFFPERYLIIHAVVCQDIIRFLDPDERVMRQGGVRSGNIRVPFLGQFAEAVMNAIDTCPAGDAEHGSGFGTVMVGRAVMVWLWKGRYEIII